MEWACENTGWGCSNEDIANRADHSMTNVKENAVHNVPDMFGDMVLNREPQKVVVPSMTINSGKHRIIDFIRKPCFVQYHVFVDTDENDGDKISINCRPIHSQTVSDRIHFMTQFYRFWRGSFCYAFLFKTSPLISARFSLRLYWNTQDEAPDNDQIRKVITVRGSTVEYFQVPYLYPIEWQRTDLEIDAFFPRIGLSLVSPIVTAGDLDGTVQVTVYRWAGSDFEFDSLRCASSSPFTIPPVEVEGQMFPFDFVSKEEPAFQSKLDSRFRRESAVYMEEVAQRYDICYYYSSLLPEPRQVSADGLGGMPNCDGIAHVYLFYRGEYDFLMPVEDASTATSIVLHFPRDTGGTTRTPPISSAIADGVVKIDPRFTSVFEARIPALVTADWLPVYEEDRAFMMAGFTFNLPEPDIQSIGGTAVFAAFNKKASPNVNYAYEIPPCSYLFWNQRLPPESVLERAKPTVTVTQSRKRKSGKKIITVKSSTSS